jgi:predicted nucleic acid-binding protein
VIILDTSGLVAALDPRQVHHQEAAQILSQPQVRILSPFVLAEVDYLIATNAGQTSELMFLGDVARGIHRLESVGEADVASMIEIIERYRDLELGIADASIVVLAERYRCCDVLTLDQRHFRTVAGPGGQPFRLLPFDTT